MECVKRLSTEQELLEWLEEETSVILFGNKSLLIILLRAYQKAGNSRQQTEGLLERVQEKKKL